MSIFGTNLFILISLLIITTISFRQYKNKSSALIFSVLFLFYIVLPLFFPIHFFDIDIEIYESASLLVLFFCFGYFLAQFIPIGVRLDVLKNFDESIFKSRKLFIILFYILTIYISVIIIYSGFNRELSSLFFDNRIQIYYVFLIAIILWTTKNNIQLRFFYVVFAAVGLMMFYSGSRIYIAPAILFIVLFYLNKCKKNRSYFLSIFLIALIIFASLFRNFEGDLFSFRSLVTILGEFYFTNLSFLVVLDREIYFQHDFFDAILVILFPSLLPNIDINSDKFINQYTNLDFGLASSLLSDIALYTSDSFLIYIASGFFIGIIYKTLAEKFYGVSYLFSLVFLSFTPILFRSGFFYLFSLIKSISIYILIILFISYITKFFKKNS